MGRLAALLVMVSQLILLWLVAAPSGRSAIVFAFLGHPLVVVGVLLGSLALARRKARERASARARSPVPGG